MLSSKMKKGIRYCLATVAAVIILSCAAYAVELQVQSGQNITDAFNEAAAGGNVEIIIPPGEYEIGQPYSSRHYEQLRLYGNTTVKMEGVTLKRVYNDASMLRLGSLTDDWDNYNGKKGRPGYSDDFSHIHFIGGTWDGNGIQRSIMQLGHAADLTFEGVTFKNVKQSHYLEFGGCKDIKIINCTFSDYVGDFGNTYNGEAVQFEILTEAAGSEHFDGYNPIGDETICQNVEITGCTFERLKRGIGSHTAIANSYFENFQIHHNTFRDITGYAVSMMNYRNSSVHDNVIENCGAGIQVSASERSHKNFYPSKNGNNSRKSPENLKVKVYNNTLTINAGANGKNYNNNNFGIWVFGEYLKKKTGSMPAGDWRASGVTVQNNTITMNAAGGVSVIWLTGTKGCKVIGNTITCNFTQKGKGSGQESAIRLEESEKDVIGKNKIKNTSKKGLGKTMIGIQVKKPEDKSKEKTKNSTISGNTVEGAALYGIKVEYASGVVFDSNTVKDTGLNAKKGEGIKIDNASNLMIKKNKVIKSTRDGIKIDNASKITFVGNTIDTTGREGIKLDEKSKISDVVINNNTFKNCGRYGIMGKKSGIKSQKGNKFSNIKGNKNANIF